MASSQTKQACIFLLVIIAISAFVLLSMYSGYVRIASFRLNFLNIWGTEQIEVANGTSPSLSILGLLQSTPVSDPSSQDLAVKTGTPIASSSVNGAAKQFPVPVSTNNGNKHLPSSINNDGIKLAQNSNIKDRQPVQDHSRTYDELKPIVPSVSLELNRISLQRKPGPPVVHIGEKSTVPLKTNDKEHIPSLTAHGNKPHLPVTNTGQKPVPSSVHSDSNPASPTTDKWNGKDVSSVTHHRKTPVVPETNSGQKSGPSLAHHVTKPVVHNEQKSSPSMTNHVTKPVVSAPNSEQNPTPPLARHETKPVVSETNSGQKSGTSMTNQMSKPVVSPTNNKEKPVPSLTHHVTKPVVDTTKNEQKSTPSLTGDNTNPPQSVTDEKNPSPSLIKNNKNPFPSVTDNQQKQAPSVVHHDKKQIPSVVNIDQNPVPVTTDNEQKPSSREISIPTASGRTNMTEQPATETDILVAAGREPLKYPKWWTDAWPRSAVWQQHSFVGDQPLFPSCTTQPEAWQAYPFVEPQAYLNYSKNPCWFEDPEARKGLRCVPYFYLAGVAKGGTTDLSRRLRMHPHIFKGTMKEYHWWERFRFGSYDEEDLEEGIDIQEGMSFKEYCSRIAGDEIYNLQWELRERESSVRIFGDYSPSYLWDPRNWYVLDGNQNCTEPRIIVGQHIHHIFPEAKILMTFRHPTPRLYSRFLSRTTRTSYLRRATAEDFHTYVLEAIQNYKACFAQWSIRHCAYNISVYRDATVRLVEGMYPVFMADWLRVWPREQMLLMRYEDYGGHEGERISEVLKFLGVAPLDEDDMEEITSIHTVNAGTKEYEKIGEMLEETKKALDEFYQPFIIKFAEMLQDPRFLWKDVPH